jgi:hypothetical protein
MAHTGITRAAAVSNTRATSNTRERDTSTRRTFSRSSLRAAAAIVTSLPGSALAATLAGLALGATLAQAAQPASAQGSNATQEFVTAHRREILDEFMHLLAIPNIASDRANMRRNADAIMDMMQRRGLAPKMLTSSREPDVPPIV